MFGYPQIILCQELFTFYLWNIGGLITAKIRLKLKKVGKTAGPFKYHRNEIPYNYMLGSAIGIIDKMEARPPAPSPHSAGTDPGMKELGLVILTCLFLSSAELTEKEY